jgi:hypothetical protein
VHLARLDRLCERFPVRVCDHQDTSGYDVLRDDHDGSGGVVEADFVEIQSCSHLDAGL